jgi:hypothetical protein
MSRTTAAIPADPDCLESADLIAAGEFIGRHSGTRVGANPE